MESSQHTEPPLPSESANRRAALTAASQRYLALTPDEIIGCAAYYTNWLDTGNIEVWPEGLNRATDVEAAQQ